MTVGWDSRIYMKETDLEGTNRSVSSHGDHSDYR